MLTYRLLRKMVKRTYWRMMNLSCQQFVRECVFRQFRTVTFDAVPQYTFAPIDPEKFARIILPHPPEFFVMIKPNGIPKESAIKAMLARQKLFISHEDTYHNFFDLSYHIFQIAKIHDYRYALPEGYIWLRLLEHFYPEHCQTTKIVFIRNGSESALNYVKRRIRQTVGVEFYRVNIGGQNMVTCMTPVHTSDAAMLERELKILHYFKSASAEMATPQDVMKNNDLYA